MLSTQVAEVLSFAEVAISWEAGLKCKHSGEGWWIDAARRGCFCRGVVNTEKDLVLHYV